MAFLHNIVGFFGNRYGILSERGVGCFFVACREDDGKFIGRCMGNAD